MPGFDMENDLLLVKSTPYSPAYYCCNSNNIGCYMFLLLSLLHKSI